MKKALILDNIIVDVVDKEFEVEKSFTWIDCADECKAHEWILENGIPVAPPPPAEITYDEKRRTSYPSVGDQLDMMMKDMKNGTTTHQTACEAVKAKFPKPE